MPRSTLCHYIRSDWDPFQTSQSKFGSKPIIPAALEEKLVKYFFLIERKYFGSTGYDVRRPAFQLFVQNKIPNPFSIAKEAVGKDWFKSFMKRHRDKLSLRQKTGTSTARATGFSKEQVRILFNLYEKELDARDYPPSRIFNVDETGLTVVQTKQPKNPHTQTKPSVWRFNCGRKGFFNNICMNVCYWNFYFTSNNFSTEDCRLSFYHRSPTRRSLQVPTVWLDQLWNIYGMVWTFFCVTKPSASDPVLVIVDGHTAHSRTLRLIVQARECHVATISLLPPLNT